MPLYLNRFLGSSIRSNRSILEISIAIYPTTVVEQRGCFLIKVDLIDINILNKEQMSGTSKITSLNQFDKKHQNCIAREIVTR